MMQKRSSATLSQELALGVIPAVTPGMRLFYASGLSSEYVFCSIGSIFAFPTLKDPDNPTEGYVDRFHMILIAEDPELNMETDPSFNAPFWRVVPVPTAQDVGTEYEQQIFRMVDADVL